MFEGEQLGMSRRQLEYELQWMLKRMPRDSGISAQTIKQLCEVMVALIDKNNAAIARSLAEQEPPEAEG